MWQNQFQVLFLLSLESLPIPSPPPQWLLHTWILCHCLLSLHHPRAFGSNWQVSRTGWVVGDLHKGKRFFKKHLKLSMEQTWKMLTPVKGERIPGKMSFSEDFTLLSEMRDSFTHSSHTCREVFPGTRSRRKEGCKKPIFTHRNQTVVFLQQEISV